MELAETLFSDSLGMKPWVAQSLQEPGFLWIMLYILTSLCSFSSRKQILFCVEAAGNEFLLTTLRKRTETGKLGLFFMFLMVAEWTTSPPHSTTRLGDDTLASWYDFMLRKPHAKICDQNTKGF